MAKDYAIKILNFKKYNPREVKNKTIWLRFENDFIENPNFAEFTSDECMVWIYILCCASKLNSEILQVPLQCSHRVLDRCKGIDEKTFHRAIQKLKQLKILEIRTSRGRYADDTSVNADDTHLSPYETRRNETRRDVTRRDEEYSSERFTLAAAFAGDQILEKLFTEREVTTDVQASWIEAFPDPAWVSQEIRKAVTWEKANPTRKKKNFGAFITRWLTKGWDQRKTAPGQAIDWTGFGGGDAA